MVQLFPFHFFWRKNRTVPSGGKFSPVFPVKRKALQVIRPCRGRLKSSRQLSTAANALYSVVSSYRVNFPHHRGNLHTKWWGMVALPLWGTSIWQRSGWPCLGNQSGRDPSFIWPLKEMTVLFIYFLRVHPKSRDGAVVRALASHQCVPGSIPGPGVICGLSLLLVFYSAPRGFSPGTPVFPSPQKLTFPNSNSILECTDISERVLLNSLMLHG